MKFLLFQKIILFEASYSLILKNTMTSKRTFGLVGDYGGSDSSGDENEDVSGGADGYLVEKKPKTVQEVQTEDSSLTKISENISDNPEPSESISEASRKWQQVGKEYDDSSLMYKYTQVDVKMFIIFEKLFHDF